MFSRFHERFGTAGLIVAVIALIAALAGTAIAAGGLTAKQKKEVKKIAKKFAGKRGPQGEPGAPGANGANGKDGAPGQNGKSALVTEIEPGEAECEERGGAEVKQEGAAQGVEVCNGAEGSPWTAGGTLPSGETLTGSWLLDVPAGEFVHGETAISFPIPLASAIEAENVKGITASSSEADKEKCDDGSGEPASAENPEADSGYLCLFVARGNPTFVAGLLPKSSTASILDIEIGASTVGAIVWAFMGEGPGQIAGTFAVTG